jgi:restriction system protein
MSTVLEAARHVLQEVGGALHYKELTRQILDRGLWKPAGKTPAATVNAQLAVAIKDDPNSVFIRTGPGRFRLRNGVTALPKSGKVSESGKILSFTEAAQVVLKKHGKPMHYTDITSEALKLKLIQTVGRTPEATMYAQIIQETQRRERRGEAQRFDRKGGGVVGLVAWNPIGLAGQIGKHNDSVRKALRQQLHGLDPAAFEALVGRLLTAIGFEEVAVTRLHGDGGVDVRGTLVIGDVIRTRMAVQAKRWKQGINIQAPTVQTVRGSLGAHEQGLIITTSDFSPGAKNEAKRLDATPVGLLNGDRLISLLIEHQIMVRREPHEMLQLGDPPKEVANP